MFGAWAPLMYRRRWYVIGIWLVLLPVFLALASQVGFVLGPGDFNIKGSQSYIAANILKNQFRQNGATDLLVVVHSLSGPVSSPSFRATVSSIVDRIRADSGLGLQSIDNPLVSGSTQLISKDQRSLALLLSSTHTDAQLESLVLTCGRSFRLLP
jgi:predicted RND superfamily exporter protein